VSAAIPRTQTRIIRWSATIEANGAAILRVDHEGISIISNVRDYASILRSSASDLLSIVGAEGSTRANAKRCVERHTGAQIEPTPLIAGMRSRVALVMGQTVPHSFPPEHLSATT
jgi:hypothetical protein